MNNNEIKYGYIDALRGYAIIGVLLVHSLAGEPGIIGSQLFGLGAKGVQLFYMVSAFTLYLSWNRRDDENYKTSNFFIRRIFRVAPMFWIASIYWLIHYNGAVYPESDYRFLREGSVVSHFLLLHGFSPYWMNSLVPGGWSVGVEMMFYMICPLLFLIIKNKQHAIFFWVVTYFLGQCLHTYLISNPLIPYESTWAGYLYSYLPTQLHVFLMGVIVYYTLNESWFQQALKLIGMAFFLFIAEFALIPAILPGSHRPLMGLATNGFVVLTFVLLIHIVKNDQWGLLNNRFIRYLGTISYSFYLIHFAILAWIEMLGIANPTGIVTLDFVYRLSNNDIDLHDYL